MGNIIKNPRIWIAPIVTSAIIGFDWAGMILISFVPVSYTHLDVYKRQYLR